MKKVNKTYFTAGELSVLFNIPKQTLLYYDKMKLIEPEFISDNGYRHYSMKQYLTLEVIINLRKIDVPISKIQEYINNRDLEEFQQMLLEKKEICSRVIEENKKMKDSLNQVLDNLKEIQNGLQYVVTLNHQPETRYFISLMDEKLDGKKKIELMAKHNKVAFENSPFKEFNLGKIIHQECFFKQHFDSAYAYISEIGSDSSLTPIHIKPAGLYLSVRIYGIVRTQVASITKRFEEFAQVNNLKIIGDIYVLPIKTYWVTNNYKEYINLVCVQVEQLKGGVKRVCSKCCGLAVPQIVVGLYRNCGLAVPTLWLGCTKVVVMSQLSTNSVFD